MLLLALAYGLLIMKRPHLVKSGVATFSIFYHHAQNFAIFAQLQLQELPLVELHGR